MEKIFCPESVAIIGLSLKPYNIPRYTLENLLRWGYRGRIFGVNPRCDEDHVDGIRIFREIEDLPEVPDLVYCLIPARHVPDMVDRCGRMGITRMAIPSGGFSEYDGKGQTLAEETLARARRHGIRFVGPNGLTVANRANGLCLPFAPILKPPAGGLSVVSQSGGVGLMILNYLKDENLGLAKFASIGNKLDLDEVDYLRYLGQDPETRIICMYLESISRGREFVEAARGVDKPVIVLKSNTTAAGKRAAMSHTAALAGDEAVIDAAFERAGIIRIQRFHELFSVAKAFHLPPMRGRRVMVMSPAGGASVMMADLCEREGFVFADPGEAFYEGLSRYSNAGVIRFANPLDMGDIYDPRFVAHVIYGVMHSDAVDGAVYTSITPDMPPGENVFRTLFRTDLSKEAWGTILSSGKPLACCLASPASMTTRFKQNINVPVFNGPEEMVHALACQMRFYTRPAEEAPDLAGMENVDSVAAATWLAEHRGERGEEGLQLLRAFGIPAARSLFVSDEERAAEAARELGCPVACKVVSPDALHKSDVGGVLLDVADVDAVRQAYGTLRDNLAAARPGARFAGMRLSPMASAGWDVFVGAHQDSCFGPVVTCGMGGIFVEVYGDVFHALCPAPAEEIRRKLEGLTCHALFAGARGGEPADVESLVELVVRVSLLVSTFPTIRELDINPVRLRGDGVQALDCRLRVKESKDVAV